MVCVCVLQAYSFVDQCDSPWNKAFTLLGEQTVSVFRAYEVDLKADCYMAVFTAATRA
jgi:hypothetical protein